MAREKPIKVKRKGRKLDSVGKELTDSSTEQTAVETDFPVPDAKPFLTRS